MSLLDSPTSEIVAGVLHAAEIDVETLRSAVRELKTWLDEQPHLPHDVGENELAVLFLQCKKRMEKVKKCLNTYYNLKDRVPELLRNRDPCQPWFKHICEIFFAVPLPELTDDYSRVIIGANLDDDVSKYIVYDVLKVDAMVFEIQRKEEITPFYTLIVDCTKSGPLHAAKYTIPVLRNFSTLLFEGYSLRLKSMHFINAPLFIDLVVSLLKFVLKSKLLKRIHVHRGLGNLHDFVPPRILPNEYGGEAGPVKELWDRMKDKIIQHRDWFLRQEESTSGESPS